MRLIHTTSDGSFCLLKCLPEELRRQVFEHLGPTIPSSIGSKSKSCSSLRHHAQLDKWTRDWAKTNDAGIVNVLVRLPYDAKASDFMVRSMTSGSDSGTSQGATGAPRIRRDTIVIPVGSHGDWTTLLTAGSTARRLRNEAELSTAPYDSTGRVVLDTRITPKIYDWTPLMSDSQRFVEISHEVLTFADHIQATLSVDASGSSFQGVYLYPWTIVPRSLEWNGVSLSVPRWKDIRHIPDQMQHTYSCDLTQAVSSNPYGTEKRWRSIVGNQTELIRQATDTGTIPKIIWHLHADPIDVDQFAKVLFEQIFSEMVPEDFVSQKIIQLQLQGESPLVPLPYDVSE